jgi:uncharacterized membrane protein YfcA
VDPLILALVLGGGFVAGIINTMAGGGSLITLPILIFAGLPATVANGTNRVAIVLQNTGALAGFKSQGYTLGRDALLLLIPSVLGALVGIRFAVAIDEDLMRKVIGLVLVVMLVPLLRRRRPAPKGAVQIKRRLWMWPVYFLVGAYGGFIQAGVGFFYLALLAGAEGLDLVRANLVKVFLILVYSVLAVVIFMSEGQVALLPGLALAVGNAAGGWVGAHLTVKKGEGLVRVVLAVAVVVSAAKLLGLLAWIGRLLGPGGA